MVAFAILSRWLMNGVRDTITFLAKKGQNVGGYDEFLYCRILLGKPFLPCKFIKRRRMDNFENCWFEGPMFRGRDLIFALFSYRFNIWRSWPFFSKRPRGLLHV